MRGLVTAGRAVRLQRFACLGSSVAGAEEARLLIAVSRVAARAATTAGRVTKQLGLPYSVLSIMASDQHHPASSRAMATLAITGRFLRRLKVTQRWCRRRLPASPRV